MFGRRRRTRYISSLQSEEFPAPTVSAAAWSSYVPAERNTIRAAMRTCVGAEDQRLMLYREDRRQMFARLTKSGWLIEQAWEGHRRDRVAVRAGTHDTSKAVHWSPWKTYFIWPGSHFDDPEAEELLNAFLTNKPSLPFVEWLELNWG